MISNWNNAMVPIWNKLFKLIEILSIFKQIDILKIRFDLPEQHNNSLKLLEYLNFNLKNSQNDEISVCSDRRVLPQIILHCNIQLSETRTLRCGAAPNFENFLNASCTPHSISWRLARSRLIYAMRAFSSRFSRVKSYFGSLFGPNHWNALHNTPSCV